jgi:deoxyadenosine/deoxycytidine kinase
VPDREQVDLFSGLYRQLLAEERRHPDWKIGMEISTKMLLSTIAAKGMEYEEFMFSA